MVKITHRAKPNALRRVRGGHVVKNSPGEFMMIAKDMLRVDRENYQRPLSESRARRMGETWSWIYCGTLTVVNRPGDECLWVVDGQHRLEAAMRNSAISELPCMVFDSIQGSAEEASHFVELNTSSRKIGTLDKYKAMLHAGDEGAKFVAECVAAVGYRVSFGNGDHTIGCVQRLVPIAKIERNRSAVRDAVSMAATLCRGQQIHIMVMRGVLWLARFHRKAFLELGSLAKMGRDRILAKLLEARTYYSEGGDRVFAQAFIDMIKKTTGADIANADSCDIPSACNVRGPLVTGREIEDDEEV